MTRDKVIALARKAGIKNDCDGVWCTADQLERFAALVEAATREACAKLVEKDDSMRWSGAADVIRARSKE